jgi:hypothetical protein
MATEAQSSQRQRQGIEGINFTGGDSGPLLRPALSISQLIKTDHGSMEFVGWVVTKLLQ